MNYASNISLRYWKRIIKEFKFVFSSISNYCIHNEFVKEFLVEE